MKLVSLEIFEAGSYRKVKVNPEQVIFIIEDMDQGGLVYIGMNNMTDLLPVYDQDKSSEELLEELEQKLTGGAV